MSGEMIGGMVAGLVAAGLPGAVVWWLAESRWRTFRRIYGAAPKRIDQLFGVSDKV